MDGSTGLMRVGHDLQHVQELAMASALKSSDFVFTAEEIAYVEASAHPLQTLAGLFAAKEALFKTLELREAVYWADMEVTHSRSGAPEFRFHGTLRDQLREDHLRALLSISHSGEYASAVVMLAAEAAPARADGAQLEVQDSARGGQGK